MRESQHADTCFVRDLGGLTRCRVQGLDGARSFVFEERRLVHEQVCVLRENTDGLGGRCVAGDHDAPAGPRLPEHQIGSEHPAVGERDRLAALQRPSLRPVRHSERVRGRDVEATGAHMLDERVADGRDAV